MHRKCDITVENIKEDKCKFCGKILPIYVTGQSSVVHIFKWRKEGFCSVNCKNEFNPILCKDVNCGRIIKRKIKRYCGYCSIECFRKNDLELYIKQGLKLPFGYIRGKELKRYGMMYEPTTEDEVIVLFSKIHERLGFTFIKIARKAYPDCICIDKNNNEIKIEFEYNSCSFKSHLGKENECNLVVCWEHDFIECPIKVISLKEFIKNDNIISVFEEC